MEASAGDKPSGVLPQPVMTEKVPEEGSDVSLIEHRFQLRSALQVSIRLPADLTDREAGRLAKFIEAIPF